MIIILKTTIVGEVAGLAVMLVMLMKKICKWMKKKLIKRINKLTKKISNQKRIVIQELVILMDEIMIHNY